MITKYCKKCNKETERQLASSKCRPCDSKKQKLYGNTVPGKITRTWSSIARRVGNKTGRDPTYSNIKLLMTREEFVEWATGTLKDWVQHSELKYATIDRVEESGHYEINNIQWLTHQDNCRKIKRNKNVLAPDGEAWCGKCNLYKLKDEFSYSSNIWNKVQRRCKECQSENWRYLHPEIKWKNTVAPEGKA